MSRADCVAGRKFRLDASSPERSANVGTVVPHDLSGCIDLRCPLGIVFTTPRKPRVLRSVPGNPGPDETEEQGSGFLVELIRGVSSCLCV